MRAIAGLLLVFTNPGTGPSRADRQSYANALLKATLEDHEKLMMPTQSISIGIGGLGGRILYIRDNTPGAKLFFMAISGCPDDRERLLALGFRLVVLSTDAHGVFVMDLEKNDLEQLFDGGELRNA